MSSRKRRVALCLTSLVFLFNLHGGQALAGTPDDAVFATAVSTELERALASRNLPGIRALLEPVTLDAFYRERGYQPAWSTAQGIHPNTQRWLAILDDGGQRRVRDAVPHRDAIDRLLTASEPREFAVLDLLLSDTFLHYVRVNAQPLFNPAALHDEWYLPHPFIDAAQVLQSALQSGAFAAAIAALEPPHDGYRRLRERLADYLDIQARGGWAPFRTHGPRLEPGVQDDEIAVLRELLTVTGDLPDSAPGSTLYDAALEQAVRRFQRRHGLLVDGIVGKATRAALAVPVERRIEQLRINLERWRWLPRDFGERYITVNSAGFDLQAHEGDSDPLTMRVIVGKTDRETPVFMANMRYLVVNPYWQVPDKIAKRDLIPEILRDQDYFARQGIRVLTGWGPDAVEVDATQIGWQDYLGDGEYLPFRLRQDPGPRNSLGRVKFMMPNLHSVYLHDTPARHLFDRPVRAFSSGCIRVEKPLALAEYALNGDRQARQSLAQLLVSGETGTLSLPEPVPVYLLYHTAWVDKEGVLHFRADIYGRDTRLRAALPALAPAHTAARSAEKAPQTSAVSLAQEP
ncbi:MAG: L,D-transpeptidase family protein [Thiogranum sp.]|nr:L,D-transpeptidase family protein [Thiogranum sp.]